MRKSTRLASIYDDDESAPSEPVIQKPAASTSKKFTPTIPAARRKKIVEDEADEKSEAKEEKPTQAHQKTPSFNQPRQRKPLASEQNVTVSGPLAMGPAGMTRSGSSGRSGAGSTAIFSGRSGAFSSRLQTTTTDFSSEPVQIEQEFALESGINPVTLKSKPLHEQEGKLTEGLILLQLPPVLPRMAAASATELAPETISGMFDLPQAEHWPPSVQGRYGKLKKYRSGRMTLELLNGFEMELAPSVEKEKLINLVAVDAEFGQSFNLGQVENHFVCTPHLS